MGATGKVVALSTSGALGLSVFLQHRLNERCVGVEKAYGLFVLKITHVRVAKFLLRDA